MTPQIRVAFGDSDTRTYAINEFSRLEGDITWTCVGGRCLFELLHLYQLDKLEVITADTESIERKDLKIDDCDGFAISKPLTPATVDVIKDYCQVCRGCKPLYISTGKLIEVIT
jgi:hypothetical protein